MTSATSTPPSYPSVRRCDQTFTYKSKEHGEVVVPDPYFYLETPPSKSDETKAFCEAQAAHTKHYIDQCKDLKDVRQMLDKVVDYPRFSSPRAVGEKGNVKYYYALNEGLQPQSTWYVATRDELLQAEKNNYSTAAGKKFFDENLLSKEGTTAVGNFYFSPDGKIAAYTISNAGSDWYSVYFRSTDEPFVKADAGEAIEEGGSSRMTDLLRDIKFSGVEWTKDGKGVIYQRYSTTTKHGDKGTETDEAKDAALYYHRIGTSQEDDVLLIDRDPQWSSNIWGAQVTEDGKWLIVNSYKGTEQKSRTFIASLDQPISSNMKWSSVAPEFKYRLSYVANVGNDFYFYSNKDAGNWKLSHTTIDPTKGREVKHVSELSDEATFDDIIPEDKESTLENVSVVDHDKVLAVYVRDVKHELYQFDLKGQKVERLLPDLLGTISSISARDHDEEAFVSTMSFTTPSSVYRLAWGDQGKDPQALPKTLAHRSTTLKTMDLSAFETRQVFVPSDDVKVPVYLTYRKDTPMDGSAPAWVYFYGGFNHGLMPTFSPRLLSWVGSYGGVLVWVNARGGGEYGKRWNDGGNFKNKKNTFKDVIAAVQYVVDEKIAAKGKIIINGGSNGGLGVLAVANMAPEGLISCAVSEVPVADQLRFNKFTAGVFWVHEYGNPDDEDMFDYLYSYSPLHNIDGKKKYPFVLIVTADHDDRVSPLHSFKTIAEMQHTLPNNPNPLLLRVTADAGHGASNSLTKVLEETTIKYCLTAQHLGLKRQPLPGSLPLSKQ